MFVYVWLSPGRTQRLFRREPVPRALSEAFTSCLPNGLRLRSLRPMSGKVRLVYDISTLLPGGPTACEARLEFSRWICIGLRAPVPSLLKMRALTSASPNGSTPLKMKVAGPAADVLCVVG